MATIETDTELYLGFIKKDELVDDCLKLFQSRVDRIMTHGGEPGHHSSLHHEIVGYMFPGVTQDKFEVVEPAEQE